MIRRHSTRAALTLAALVIVGCKGSWHCPTHSKTPSANGGCNLDWSCDNGTFAFDCVIFQDSDAGLVTISTPGCVANGRGPDASVVVLDAGAFAGSNPPPCFWCQGDAYVDPTAYVNSSCGWDVPGTVPQ